MKIEFAKLDLENSSHQEQVEIKDFNAEITLKYTTKKDGISGDTARRRLKRKTRRLKHTTTMVNYNHGQTIKTE